jgi:hypothetical protein
MLNQLMGLRGLFEISLCYIRPSSGFVTLSRSKLIDISTSSLLCILHRYLYVVFFLCRVGLSYLGCRRFYEGAQSQAHGVNLSPGSSSKTDEYSPLIVTFYLGTFS